MYQVVDSDVSFSSKNSAKCSCLSSLTLFFKRSIELHWTYTKLHTFKGHVLIIIFKINSYLWNYLHNKVDEHIHHTQWFP